jgi:CheY-like chemotaxis protein
MNLADMITTAVEASQPLLTEKNIRFSLSLPEPVVALDCDYVRLTQVFTNLLNNSARYTPCDGEVRLSADLEGKQVVVRVTDTGKGIEPDEHNQLFQMYYQGRDSLPGDGLGIGLNLVFQIVQLHGGHVEAKSEGRDAGSEFIVRLPVLEIFDREPWRPLTAKVTRLSGVCRVLVVDDNEDYAKSLTTLLKLEGFDARMATNGVAALEAASEFLPDAILSDILMPGMNGYELARAIRAQFWGRNTVLIALTGFGLDSDVRRSQQAGFDTFLTKPVAYESLAAALEDCFLRRAADQAKPAVVPTALCLPSF